VQLDRPACVLLPYAGFTLGSGHCVQAVSPALEKEPAAHEEQTVLFVAAQAEEVKAPAAQTRQAAQGATPEALYEVPATQGRGAQREDVAFHACVEFGGRG